MIKCLFTVIYLAKILQQEMVGLFKIDWRSSDSATSKEEGIQTVGVFYPFFILTDVHLCKVKLYSGQEWRLHNRLH